MLRTSAEDFFSNYDLSDEVYKFKFEDTIYIMHAKDVITRIHGKEEKCLFILKELDASYDFVFNVYLKDLAKQFLISRLKANLIDEIIGLVSSGEKKYKFSKEDKTYVIYRNEEKKYQIHEDLSNLEGVYNGYSNPTKFIEVLNNHL